MEIKTTSSELNNYFIDQEIRLSYGDSEFGRKNEVRSVLESGKELGLLVMEKE